MRASLALLLPLLAAALVAPAARAQTAGGSARFYETLRGVHVAGYQGWFACPGDGAEGIGWGHWFRGGANPQDPNSLAVDMWPDTSELGADERCPTAFHLPSGATAFLFSDQNPRTVARHFAWMKEYGIDGAAMQRFLVAVVRADLRHDFDKVLGNARAGAEASGRGFFVMYDLSGTDGAVALQLIAQDWPHLTGDLHLTESPAYIFDRGKPVVGVWGLGFNGRPITAEQGSAIIHYLRNAPIPATVLGGVPISWRIEPQWAAVHRSLDVISPWSIAFGDDEGADAFAERNLMPDIAETRRLGIEYMPVVFPGFSWRHGAGWESKAPLNVTPRRCGAFYRRQIDNALKAGAEMLYTAMFDEINEGTAIFKLAADPSQEPVGTDLFALDADGCATATSDMYLRIAGEATRALRATKNK